MNRTAIVWDERYAWHDTGSVAALIGSSYVQPGSIGESAESKRRILNLLDATGLLSKLDVLKPEPATQEDLLRSHSQDYIDQVKGFSEGVGGQSGPLAWVGPGSFHTLALAVGGVLGATDAVMTGRVANAYALTRPPGHHASRNTGGGLCTFNNIAIAIEYARAKYGLERIALIDWDAHHGNGAQELFWEDPGVLTISLHQKGTYPLTVGMDGGNSIGGGKGEGYNVNIALPAGSGCGAYKFAFEEIVDPALEAFQPQLIFVASGVDAGFMDLTARLMLTAQGFGDLTRYVMELAQRHCNGKLVIGHEGGYDQFTAPFHVLKIFEQLSGEETDAEDPNAPFVALWDGHELQAHQQDYILESLPVLRILQGK